MEKADRGNLAGTSNFLTSGPAPRTTTSDCNDFQSQTRKVKSETEDAREHEKKGVEGGFEKRLDRFREQTLDER